MKEREKGGRYIERDTAEVKVSEGWKDDIEMLK